MPKPDRAATPKALTKGGPRTPRGVAALGASMMFQPPPAPTGGKTDPKEEARREALFGLPYRKRDRERANEASNRLSERIRRFIPGKKGDIAIDEKEALKRGAGTLYRWENNKGQLRIVNDSRPKGKAAVKAAKRHGHRAGWERQGRPPAPVPKAARRHAEQLDVRRRRAKRRAKLLHREDLLLRDERKLRKAAVDGHASYFVRFGQLAAKYGMTFPEGLRALRRAQQRKREGAVSA